MSVTTTNNRVSYTGDGTSVNFTVTMPFFAASDLIVYVTDTNGNTTTKVLNTDYTVTGGNDATGTVTFTAAPASGYIVQIVRAVPYTQANTYINNDPDDATVRENADDKLTMLIQQVLESVGRGVVQPAADTTAMGALPTEAQRAGKYMAFDLSGNPIATTEVGSWRQDWAVGTQYFLGDVIRDGAAGNNTLDIYTCAKANTASASFANDLAAGDWSKVIDVVQIGANAGTTAVNSLAGTSTTSLTIGTGSQTLTTQAGKAFNVGSFVTVVDSAAITNFMAGQVTAYNSGTGALTVNVTQIGGSGTLATWNIYVSGEPFQGTPVPTGGTTGQALVKNSGTNGDVKWSNVVAQNYLTTVLAADVTLTASYQTIMTLATGAVTGTFEVEFVLTVEGNTTAATVDYQITDGTTVFGGCQAFTIATSVTNVAVRAKVTNPAANVVLQAKFTTGNAPVIAHNLSGTSGDSSGRAIQVG